MLEKLALAGTIGAGLAIGLVWPTAHRPIANSNGTNVVIARSADHHYYVDAKVNGTSVHFMVDTGASETALTEADARAVGLAVDPSKYEVLGDGASGLVRGQFVVIRDIDVGGIHQAHFQAVVIPGANVSLLGQPFLEQLDELVIRKDEMQLVGAHP